jgi:hypothetical protein
MAVVNPASFAAVNLTCANVGSALWDALGLPQLEPGEQIVLDNVRSLAGWVVDQTVSPESVAGCFVGMAPARSDCRPDERDMI